MEEKWQEERNRAHTRDRREQGRICVRVTYVGMSVCERGGERIVREYVSVWVVCAE